MWAGNRINAVDIWATRHGGSSSRERGSETPPQMTHLPPQMPMQAAVLQQICTSKHISPTRRRVEPEIPPDTTILQRGTNQILPPPVAVPHPVIVNNPHKDAEVSQLKGQIHKLEREISRLSMCMEGIAEEASKNMFLQFREGLIDEVRGMLLPQLLHEQENLIKKEVQKAAGFNPVLPITETKSEGSSDGSMYASRRNSRVEEKPYSRRSTALTLQTDIERDPLPSPTRLHPSGSINFQQALSGASTAPKKTDIAEVVEQMMVPHQSRLSKIEHSIENGVSERIQNLQEFVESHLEPQLLKMNELETLINKLRSSASDNMMPVAPLPTAAEQNLAPPQPLQSINLQVPELRENISNLISQEVPELVKSQVEQLLASDIPILVVSKVQDQVDKMEGTLDAKVAERVQAEIIHELQGGGGLTPVGSMVSMTQLQEADLDMVTQRVKGEMQKTVEQTVRNQVHEQLTSNIRKNIDETIQNEVSGEVERHMNRRASTFVSQPSIDVQADIEQQLKVHTSQIPQQVRSQVKSQLQTQVASNVKSQVREQLQEQLTTGLQQQIQHTIQSQVQRQVNREMEEHQQKLQKLESDLNNVRGDISESRSETGMGIGMAQLEARVQGLEISSAWQPPPPPPPSEPADASQLQMRNEQQIRIDELAMKIENLNDIAAEARDLRSGLSSRLAAVEAAPKINDVERNLHRRIDEIIDHRSKQSNVSKFDTMESNAQSVNLKRRIEGIENQTSKVQELASVNKSILVRLEMLESQPAHQELKRRVDELADTRGTVNNISARLDNIEELTSVQALERGVQRHLSDKIDPVVDKMGNVERAVNEIERRMSQRIDQLADNKVSTAQISARLDNLDSNISYCYNLQKRVDEIDRTTCKISTIDDRLLPRVKAVEDQVLPRLSALENDLPSRLRHVEEQLPKFNSIEDAVIPRFQTLEDNMHLRVSGLEDRVLPRIKTIEDQLPRYKKALDTELPKLSSAEDTMKQKIKQLEDTLVPKVRSIDSIVVPKIRATEVGLTQKLLGLEERILPRVELVEEQMKNSRGPTNPMSDIQEHVSTQIGDYTSIISAKIENLEQQTGDFQATIMPAVKEHFSMHISQVEEAQKNLTDKIEKLEKKNSVLEAAMGPTIQDHVSAVQAQLSTKIQNIESSALPTIKNHISHVESEINVNLNKMQEKLESNLATIQDRTEQLLPHVNNQLKSHMSTVEQHLNTVQNSVIPLKVKELQSHISGVESKVDHFESTIVPLKVKEQLSGVKGEIQDKITQFEEKTRNNQDRANKETDLKIQRLEKKNESLERVGSQLAQAMIDENTINSRLTAIETQLKIVPVVRQEVTTVAEKIPALESGTADCKNKITALESATADNDTELQSKVLPRLKVIEKSLLNLQDATERTQGALEDQKQPPDVTPRIEILEEEALPLRIKTIEDTVLPRLAEIEKLIPDIKKDLKKPSQIQEMLTPLIKIVEGQVMPRLQAVETSIPDLNAILETVKKLRSDSTNKDINTIVNRLQTGLVAVATQQEKTKEECAMVCGTLRNEVAALKTAQKQQIQQRQQFATPHSSQNQLGAASSRISPSRRM
eukprot:TRINITY_DN10095_c0_g1_i3.p1 TRINITY_DN10095_c0_g1~~TRINITY_DN10095_c0_g1_i3.p1  ORF type:complete len:1578 (+),score=362.12 TRINITY_DN10095_c0_g1_i3:29-4762(+)